MDDPNITMEEYIRLEEEKARKHGKVFNWETAKYGKIWYDEDVLDLRSVETEFPAIVFNDNLTSNETPFCEPTISSLNDNEIEFRISFDESEDEDYTPTVSCIDDLDFFKDFENEFPAIVYNDALTFKSDFSTEPTLCPQHIDEFDFKDETSLSKYDMAPLQPHEQRYPFFRYQGLEYYDQDIANFKERMLMKHRDDDRVMLFTSQAWGKFSRPGTTGRSPELRMSWRTSSCSGIYIHGDKLSPPVLLGPTRQEGDAGGAAEEASIAPDCDEDEEMPHAMPSPD
ncbi:hypothetical protein Tco_0853291 [Tanacetum coccineum]